MLLDLVEKAIQKRDHLLKEHDIVRLVDGIGDDLPGLYLDKLGKVAIAHIHSDSHRHAYQNIFIAQSVLKPLGVEGVYLRQHFSESAKSAEKEAHLISGVACESLTVSEHGISYQIYPSRYVNAGFFADMRNVRKNLLQQSNQKRVLNLFCYSGSLGLSALVGGAREVVQVDISKGALALAKENLALNVSSVTGSMRFICEDSSTFLQKEGRRVDRGNDRFDIVIVDPPSFSRSKQGAFKVERDFEQLIEEILQVCAPSAQVFATCNLATFSARDMSEKLQLAAHGIGRKAKDVVLLSAPVDFTSTPELSIAMRGVTCILQ